MRKRASYASSMLGFGQSWNPHSYVLNSSLNFVDPSGFDPATACKTDGETTVCVTRDPSPGAATTGNTAAAKSFVLSQVGPGSAGGSGGVGRSDATGFQPSGAHNRTTGDVPVNVAPPGTKPGARFSLGPRAPGVQ